jgi:uncharacterized protein (TIGR03083 family)
MDLSEAPVTDVRPLLGDERRDLLRFLRTLTPQEWAIPSAAPAWSVKDLALHLLDDDLGWLSRDRDGDRSGLLAMEEHESFVVALAAKNQRWIDGAHGLSPKVLTELLEWSGQQMDAYYASMELLGKGHVSWANDGEVPTWFDIAQDLTERWVHQMQMREAVGRVEGYAARYLPVVLRTFVWALPHQYRVEAPKGTTVQVDLAAGGRWRLTSDGSSRWSLDEGTAEAPDAHAEFTDEAGWRWLTGATLPPEGVRFQGPSELCQPLLGVRGILV